MVNPVDPAQNFFLAFWSALPDSIKLLILVGIGLTFIGAIIRIIFL